VRKIKIVILVSLVIVITSAAFFPCLRNGFVNLDDDKYVTDNAVIKHLSWVNLKNIFSSFFVCNYIPVTMLSYSLEHSFFKLNPACYHLTNLILHLLNCILIFWLLAMMSDSFFVAFVTAVLFGIHPLHVESVAWISERKDVLYAFFFLAAFISYLYFIRSERRSLRYYWFSLAMFILSILSKPMAIMLPFILVLVEYSFFGKSAKFMLRDKIPFFITSFIFGILTVFSQYSTGAVRKAGLFNLPHKLMIASYSIIFYLKKMLMPFKLSCMYPFPRITNDSLLPIYLVSLLAVFVLFTAVVISGRYTKKVIFGACFFLITVLPVLQLIPIGRTIVADRYVYIPSLGIFYLIAEGLRWVFKKANNFLGARILILIILTGIISALTFQANQRCKVWKDSVTLWVNVLNNYRDVPSVAYNNLGIAYRSIGEFERAKANLEKSLEIDPSYSPSYVNLGNLYNSIGDSKKAITLYNRSLSIERNSVEAYFNLGVVYNNIGRKEEAMKMFEKAIAIEPAHLLSYVNLINLYEASGKQNNIASLYEKAIANDLDYFDAYFYAGNLYSGKNKTKKAIPFYKRAIRISPDSVEAYNNLAVAYSKIGNIDKAISLCNKALGIDNNFEYAHLNLAEFYFQKRQYNLAIEHCDKAIELGNKVDPNFLEVLKQYRR
jgi:tetratricopeptide (TPR) repeat protein